MRIAHDLNYGGLGDQPSASGEIMSERINIRRLIAMDSKWWFALRAALLLLASSACGEPPETCITQSVSYAGTSDGPSFFKASTPDNSLILTQASPSIALLEQFVNRSTYCWKGGDEKDVIVEARAWIDKSDSASTNCADVQSPTCEPTTTDPQGRQSL